MPALQQSNQPAPDDGEAVSRPQSKIELFLTCSSIALQGFGGVLAIIQREVVDKRRWMTRKQFVEDWAVAQILPGPNVINLVIGIGDRYFGIAGSLAAIAGIVALPLCIVLAMMTAYTAYADQPIVLGALRGMGAAAAGLIGATSIKMLRGLKGNVLGIWPCAMLIAGTFVSIGLLHMELPWAVLGLGIPACIAAWLRLRHQARVALQTKEATP